MLLRDKLRNGRPGRGSLSRCLFHEAERADHNPLLRTAFSSLLIPANSSLWADRDNVTLAELMTNKLLLLRCEWATCFL